MNISDNVKQKLLFLPAIGTKTIYLFLKTN